MVNSVHGTMAAVLHSNESALLPMARLSWRLCKVMSVLPTARRRNRGDVVYCWWGHSILDHMRSPISTRQSAASGKASGGPRRQGLCPMCTAAAEMAPNCPSAALSEHPLNHSTVSLSSGPNILLAFNNYALDLLHIFQAVHAWQSHATYERHRSSTRPVSL